MNLEEYYSKEYRKKTNYKGKDKIFNNKEKYEKESNINLEEGKKGKLKLEKNKEKIQTNKKGNIKDNKDERNIFEYDGYDKFYKKYYIDNFIENKYLPDDLNIKRRYIKMNKNKYNKFHFIYFYFIIINITFFLQFINCNHRKIEFTSSYIKLKTNGTGYIRILNANYYQKNKPSVISINNTINYTNNGINCVYNFDNEINNITLIWDSPPTTAEEMFNGCYDIIEIDLSNFDTSSVSSMGEMFSKCFSLNSLDLSNFDTSNVTSMYGMFNECQSLTSLDLSNFDTSSVKSMEKMFSFCIKLNYLDISNFDTSNVLSKSHMFYYCKSLISLDLSNFDTSKVTSMVNMFDGCSSLNYLDLSNFNFTQVKNIYNIFCNCKKLVYVNLKKAKIKENLPVDSCEKNLLKLIICSENEEWGEKFDFLLVQKINCISNTSYFNINKTINNIHCFKRDNTELDNPCQICGNNYLEIVKNNEYINCYEYQEGFYFDYEILNYRPCYSSCKKCNESGNETEHNCIECKEEYNLEFNISYYKNCFINSNNNLETDKITENEIESNKRTELIQNMINDLFTKLNIYKIDNGLDENNIWTNLLIKITSTKNQKNNENENMITIDLCECENILKDEYNISKNNSLYILQIIYE